MKKKWIAFAVVVLLLAGGTAFAVYRMAAGRKPFKDLGPDGIAAATVEVLPPDKSARLDREAIGSLAGMLRAATVYQKDDSFRSYSGQAVIYTITMTDGTTLTVQAYCPFLIIDGIGYRTEYEPCHALNVLGNELVS